MQAGSRGSGLTPADGCVSPSAGDPAAPVHPKRGWIRELVELKIRARLWKHAPQVRRDVLNSRFAPRLDPIESAIDPVELITKLRMPKPISFLDQLPAHHSKAPVHRIRVAILSEKIAKIINDRRDSRHLFS